jgi:hypothetical protein
VFEGDDGTDLRRVETSGSAATALLKLDLLTVTNILSIFLDIRAVIAQSV